jgi:hypothetical protein
VDRDRFPDDHYARVSGRDSNQQHPESDLEHEAGARYQLQYNSDLSSSNWINLGSLFTATGATLNTTDSVTNGPQRFYRVVLLP